MPASAEYLYEYVPNFGLAPCERVIVPIASPSAGAGFTYVVPSGSLELIMGMRYVLATSAAAANRQPTIRFRDGDGGEFADTALLTTIAASQTISVSYVRGVGAGSQATLPVMIAPLPEFLLSPGYQVVTVVSAMDAADTITGIRIYTLRMPILAPGATEHDPRNPNATD